MDFRSNGVRARGGVTGCVAALCLVAAALAGCSRADLVNALTPGGGYSVTRDIVYGDGPRQRYDLYVPDDAAADAPLVVFFYGGRWQDGSKATYRFAGQAFASRGYVTAIPDYRLYPEVGYQGFLRDGAAAVIAAVDRLGGWAGGRPVYLVGHSAGAYIALMLALDPTWLAAEGAPCRLVDAGVGLAGPYDFLPLDSADLQAIFAPGGPETQPISHADGGDPPVLLITGSGDVTVRPANTANLAARLRERGGRAEVRSYDGIGHIWLVASLAAPLRFTAPTLDDIDGFLESIGPQSGC
jgi:acetyl esterase/lipase